MPVYTYRCEECGFVFDVQLGFHDPKPEVCPRCGAKALRRVYKPVGIIFKGSGFYATDHRSSSGNGAGKGTKPSSEKTKEGKPASSEKTTSNAPAASGDKTPTKTAAAK